jgi:cell division protein FtsB
MKDMNHFRFRYILITILLVIFVLKAESQSTMPDELSKSNLKDQIIYLETHTRIYEYYRAVREDMFQKLKINVTDTLTASKNEIALLNMRNSALSQRIDTLNNALSYTKLKLEEVTASKNSIRFFGLEINKSTYNTIMWTIVFALLILLFLGFVVFKRNYIITSNTNKELKDLKEEFENYRKSTREAREKASMEHFNEIKKLRGG